jgi:hypothetical protein
MTTHEETPYDRQKRQEAGDALDAAMRDVAKFMLENNVRMPSPSSIADIRVTAAQAQAALEKNRNKLDAKSIKVMGALFGSVSMLMELQLAMDKLNVSILRQKAESKKPDLILPDRFKKKG